MSEKRKILLVDDNPVNLKMARNILMDVYNIFTVPSAEKMFQFLEKVVPDLILLDILMPETTGYEAIKKLKSEARTCGIPVIFLTSKNDAESEMEGLSLGAVDYISKPFVPHLLLKRIELHMLVESQKEELRYINANLQQLVDIKTSAVMELQNAVLSTVSELVECRDDVTGNHVARTSYTLKLLIEELLKLGVYTETINEWDHQLVIQSSQLHDVGKISIHDNILLKPDKLTPEEFDEMKKHASFGEEIISKMQQYTKENDFLVHAKIMAGTHHEKWDGSGYPRHLSGEEIPLQGRLMAIADVYDALISERPYKKAFTVAEAVKIITESFGSHFDPKLEQAFLHSVERLSQEEA
jgi:putative two-component system response regulator